MTSWRDTLFGKGHTRPPIHPWELFDPTRKAPPQGPMGAVGMVMKPTQTATGTLTGRPAPRLGRKLTAAESQMFDDLKSRVLNLVTRGVLTKTDDANEDIGFQLSEVTLLKGEAKATVERFQQYGFTSNPPVGSECLVLFVGGGRDHGIVISVDNRVSRMPGLAEGEVGIYSDEGDFIVLKRDNTIETVTKHSVLKAEEDVTTETKAVSIKAEDKVQIETKEATTKADTITLDGRSSVNGDMSISGNLNVSGSGWFAGGHGPQIGALTRDAPGSLVVGGTDVIEALRDADRTAAQLRADNVQLRASVAILQQSVARLERRLETSVWRSDGGAEHYVQ